MPRAIFDMDAEDVRDVLSGLEVAVSAQRERLPESWPQTRLARVLRRWSEMMDRAGVGRYGEAGDAVAVVTLVTTGEVRSEKEEASNG